MASLVSCPRCGEEDDLDGESAGGVITVRCNSCGLTWERDTTPRCPSGGSEDVRPAFEAVVEKSRGTQLSMQSARLIHLCPICDGGRLSDYHRTNSPLMPDELPTVDPSDR